MADNKTVYFSPRFIEVLKQNTYMSPETIRLINNPVWAYIRTRLKSEDKDGR